MSKRLLQLFDRAKAALLAADIDRASSHIDEIKALLEREGLTEEHRQKVEPRLTELRALAQACLTGTRQAYEQIQAIIQAANSLQTYDSSGRRSNASVVQRESKRF